MVEMEFKMILLELIFTGEEVVVVPHIIVDTQVMEASEEVEVVLHRIQEELALGALEV